MTTPDPTDWDAMTAAVAAAAYRVEERGAAGFDAADPTSTAAVAVIDGGLRAVEARRRIGRSAGTDVPLVETVFDGQALSDLVEFLRAARQGALTRQEIVQEARLWLQLGHAGWPQDAHDAADIAKALHLLASLPDAEMEPVQRIPVEPANDLERAMVAVTHDEAARPALWRALHDGEVVLPVMAYELVRPEGANFQLLAAPFGDTPMVFGFTSDERFDTLLPDDAEVSRVKPLGRDLPKFWPAGHWLTINPGYDNQVVLNPWEIAGLPDGPRSELPDPRATIVEPPPDDDPRRPLLAGTVASLPGVDHIIWARVRPRRSAATTAWQDVIVVTATGTTPTDSDAAEGQALQSLTSALPRDQFPKAVFIPRQSHVAHPFIETIATTGHRIAP